MVKDGIYLSGRYQVLSKIGAGGMADVYKAKDSESPEKRIQGR